MELEQILTILLVIGWAFIIIMIFAIRAQTKRSKEQSSHNKPKK